MYYLLLFNNISENPLWKEQIQARIILRDINMKVWLELNVFSIVWWFMLITCIVTNFIWWKLVNKSRLSEIVTYGLMVALTSTILDIIGGSLVLWGYPNMAVPLVPPLIFVDLTMLPVTYMLIYQYFTRWKYFFIAMIITSFLMTFIGEPIAVYLDMYELNIWKHIYSFPLYIILALILKWVNSKIYSKKFKIVN